MELKFIHPSIPSIPDRWIDRMDVFKFSREICNIHRKYQNDTYGTTAKFKAKTDIQNQALCNP